MVMLAATRYYPLLERALMALIPASMLKMQEEHYKMAQTKIQRRLNSEKTRDDFMTPVLTSNHDFASMSRGEVESTYQMLIIAGSETTATALVGIILQLAQNPDKRARLIDEIRGRFTTSNDINVASTRDLPYLTACIDEGLRLCNPVPAGLPRCAPSTGATVCGQWLPAHVSTSFPHTHLPLTSLLDERNRESNGDRT
jgi:cytochrome P450